MTKYVPLKLGDLHGGKIGGGVIFLIVLLVLGGISVGLYFLITYFISKNSVEEILLAETSTETST